MATVGSINIGLSASTAVLAKDLNKGSGLVQGFAARVETIGGGVRGLLGAVGSGLAALGVGAGIKHAITAASDLNETVGKTEIVLGPASDAVKAYADDVAARFGLVKKDTLDAASAFGGLGKGLAGLRGDELADFSIQFTQLSADLSSFANVSFEEARTALQAGLIGNESDTLKGLGVILTADTVKAHAYASGIAAMGSELTEAQKVAARSQLIMRGLADAHGNLELTSDGVSNSAKEFQGRLENLSATAGTALEPVTSAFLSLGNTGLKAVSDALANNKGLIEDVGLVVRNLPDIFEVAKLQITQSFLNIGETIAVIPENLGIIASYVASNWKELILDGINAVGIGFQNLQANLIRLGGAIVEWLQNPTKGIEFQWAPLLTGFEATAAELPTLVRPHLTSLQGEIDNVLARIGQKELKRTEDIAAAAAAVKAKPEAPVTAAELPEKTKAKKAEKVGALELGSAEARTAILEHRAGGGRDKIQTDQLATQKQMLGALNKIAGKPGQGGPSVKVLSLTT